MSEKFAVKDLRKKKQRLKEQVFFLRCIFFYDHMMFAGTFFSKHLSNLRILRCFLNPSCQFCSKLSLIFLKPHFLSSFHLCSSNLHAV